MDVYCTRPGCPKPVNTFVDLDDSTILKTVQQKYCITCGMPLILIGRYLTIRLLGQGGFGAAYLARDRYTPAMRSCVVKVFQPAGDLTPDQLAIAQNLFEREATVLEELGNKSSQIPNLLAFFPLEVPSMTPGKLEQFFYLVQEFIDGQTLEEELTSKGKFSEAEVLVMLREILNVLEFVHQNGVIHRDIKLSNIMRDRHGHFYLLDFGAVKQVTKAPAVGGNQRSTGIYSMGFAPPEQMSGGQVYPSTDLYALAVTCICLLTGKEPKELFDSYTNQWNWRSHIPGVSEQLAQVLDKMLLSTPSQRFDSAAQVRDQLFSPVPLIKPNPLPATIVQNVAATPPVFSLVKLLSGAAFVGFEGGLLFIALGSILQSPLISMGILGLVLGGLIFAQSRRVIKGKDLPIIAGITLAIIVFCPPLHSGFELVYVIIIAVLAGLGAIAITALFRLIYNFLSNII